MTARLIQQMQWTLLILFSAAFLAVTGCGERGTGEDAHGDGHADAPGYVPVAHSHDDSNETCFICDASKREKGRLWCNEHARYEDRCWYCHPELEDKSRMWCKEHSLYEDECFLCHPELKDDSATSDGSKPAEHQDGDGHAGAGSGGLFCNEHNVPEIECAICQPDLAASLKPGGSMKVRFPSTEAAEKVGILTDRPRVAESAPGIQALCEVQYNLNAMAKVTPLAGGVIRSVNHDLGDRVETGEMLIELHSAEAAEAKSDYLSALVERDIRHQAFEREKRLKEQKIAAEKHFLQARAALRTVELSVNNLRQKLVNLGFTDQEVKQIERDQDTSARLVIRAPFDGTLIDRGAVVGEAVEVGDAVFTVADLSSRWLMLSVPSTHVARIRTGQVAEARFNELPGVTIDANITWIDTSIDPRSRMVRARALVTDDADRIKTGLFGKARIVTGEVRPATIVPREAVQRHEGGTYVFVRDEPDLFSLRRVALGGSKGDRVEVLKGLEPHDTVVTSGSFLVMSEFLKSRLGAGCVDH